MPLKSDLKVTEKWQNSTDHNTTFYQSIIVPYLSFLTLKNIVTLKSRLDVTQDHWKLCHSIDWIRVSIRLAL